MSSKRYPEEFKIEAVRQIRARGHSVAQVADQLGVTTHSRYAWLRKYGPDSEQHQAKADDQAEIRRFQRELKRVTEDGDILKKPRRTSPVSPIEVRLHSREQRWPIRKLCSLLDVHPSGFYAWQRQPRPVRAVEDERLSGLIKQFWLESGTVYGYRKIHTDLREYGEGCEPNRFHRLMCRAGIRAQVGYRKRRHQPGERHTITPNILQRRFNPEVPNESWVTDITYIRTHKG